MPKKYKIILDRKGCIGAAACVAILPEFWEMVDDGKVTILDRDLSKKAKKSQDYEEIILELNDEQLQKQKDAAEVCPVVVIHIEDMETGERII